MTIPGRLAALLGHILYAFLTDHVDTYTVLNAKMAMDEGMSEEFLLTLASAPPSVDYVELRKGAIEELVRKLKEPQ